MGLWDNTTNLNYPKNYIHVEENSKTLLKTPPPELCSTLGIYRKKRAPEELYGVVCQRSTYDSTIWLQKRCHGHVLAAMLWPLAPRRSIGLVPAVWVVYSLSIWHFLLPEIADWAPKTWASSRL